MSPNQSVSVLSSDETSLGYAPCEPEPMLQCRPAYGANKNRQRGETCGEWSLCARNHCPLCEWRQRAQVAASGYIRTNSSTNDCSGATSSRIQPNNWLPHYRLRLVRSLGRRCMHMEEVLQERQRRGTKLKDMNIFLGMVDGQVTQILKRLRIRRPATMDDQPWRKQSVLVSPRHRYLYKSVRPKRPC